MKKFISNLGIFGAGAISTLMIGVGFAQTMGFPDVKSTDWFYHDVNNMVNWGVIQGNTDGTFKPGNNVNRAELSAMWNRYDKYLATKYYTKAEIDTLLGKKPSDSAYSSSEASPSDSKTISLNTAGTLNGVSLTIKSVKDFSTFNEYFKPEDGNKYVAIDVFIENNSGQTISINPLNFSLKDSESYEYEQEFVSGAEPRLNLGDLENMKTLRGFLVYEVPKTAVLSEIKYEVDYGSLGQFYVELN
ncbi:MAG: DUF4352 domain-containing protein [Candidatus Altimarinota bacterium]